MSCPHCYAADGDANSDRSDATTGPSRAVARSGSLAEAGWIASLLEAQGIATRIHWAESFDAVDGVWRSSHTVNTSGPDAVRAAELLRAEIDGPDIRTAAPATTLTEGEAANLLRPVTLLVAVGALAWAIGTGRGGPAARPVPPDAEPASSLSPALRAIGAPLHASLGPGRPRFRLHLDTRTSTWELAVDADRDGAYDQLRRFRAEPVAAAVAPR